MSFFDFFRKKSRPSDNLPSDGLRDYLSALEKSDHKSLLRAVVMQDGSSDVIEFAIIIMAVLGGFQDIYGRDAAHWASFEVSPQHTLKDLDKAEFHTEGESGLARMADGYIYHLTCIAKRWRVHWPEFKLNGIIVDGDLARAVNGHFAEARASLGKDLITAEEISSVLQDSLNKALVPFSERMPQPYNTFPLHDLATIQAENISPALRTALETAYESFREAVSHKDPTALFANTIIRSSEREILQKKVESGDFSDFSDWIAMMNPPLDDTHFVTVKTDGDDFAAYYFAWSSSYSDHYQNLSVRKFETAADGWKIIYSLLLPIPRHLNSKMSS